MTIQERKAQLMKKVYRMMFAILIIFGIPAVVAYFAGAWIDSTYEIRPAGSIISLIIAAVISWIIMIRIYLNIQNEWKVIQNEEEQEKDSQ